MDHAQVGRKPPRPNARDVAEVVAASHAVRPSSDIARRRVDGGVARPSVVALRPRTLTGPVPQLQAKRICEAASDPFERVADGWAEPLTKGHAAATHAAQVSVINTSDTPVVARKCACQDSGTPCADCGEQEPVARRMVDDDDANTTAGRGDEPNHAILRRLPSIQPKLRLSQPEDPSEHEADDIADYVIKAAKPQAVDGAIESHVSSAPGDPAIPVGVRGFMESHIGADFSGVRIHRDRAANDLADKFNARAFTVGRDIFFGPDQFTPTSEGGQHLIAHELAHVMQQGAAGPLTRHGAGAAGGADVMRQAEEAEPAQVPTPDTTTEPTEEAVSDEDGAEVELEEVGSQIAVPGLTTLPAGGFPDAAAARIDRQPKPTKAQGPPKPSGVTVQPVQVLNDKQGAVAVGKSAETTSDLKGHPRVLSIKGRVKSFKMSVTRRIQTTYKPGVDKTSDSAFGRGTTQADKAAGHTTLQFHESQHVADMKDYYDNHPLPEFTGKEGMTDQEFRAALDKYEQDLKDYNQKLNEATKQNTDCVGVPESTCPTPTPAPSAPPPTPPPAPSGPPTPPPAPSTPPK